MADAEKEQFCHYLCAPAPLAVGAFDPPSTSPSFAKRFEKEKISDVNNVQDSTDKTDRIALSCHFASSVTALQGF
jgi:hypothetical protein